MTDWPTRTDGTNKTIGEMTEEERRPLLRAAFLRSKIGEVAPAWKDAFAPAEYDDEQDPSGRIRAAITSTQQGE